MFTLTWLKPSLKSEQQPAPFLFTPSGDRFTIGRRSTCDRQVLADGISGLHCTLIKEADEWVVVDGDGVNGSRYGIFYRNGERCSKARMVPSQTIVLLNSAQDEIILRRDSWSSVGQRDTLDLTVNHELSTRVLVESLTDQTQQFEVMMKQERSYRDEQVKQFLELLNVVCDETKRLRTDFSVSTVDDGDRDKKMTELRTLTRLLAIIVGGAGLWLLVKDQQTASNVFGIVIMIGGAVGFGRSGKK